MHLKNRHLPFILAAALGPLGAQSVALSFDDAPALDATPRLTADARNQKLLATLESRSLKVALFANGIHGGDTPAGQKWLRTWGEAGHQVGNHTYHHRNLQCVTPEAYLEDIKACDAVIRTLPGYRAWFRFPYLKEGDTLAKREAVRSGLKAMGYRNAPITISTFDWLIDERLQTALKKQPNADLAPYRAFYLQHVLKLAQQYRDLAQRVLGRDIPHVILLHHNLLNALFLGDLLQAFQKNGWSFVTPDAAYADPVYALEPKPLATGESLLWSLALEHNQEAAALTKLEAFYQTEKALLEELGL